MKIRAAMNSEHRRIGQQHHNAKLSDADVDAVFALREQGLSLAQLADKFSVKKPAIWKILHGLRRGQPVAFWKVVEASDKAPPRPANRPRVRPAPAPQQPRDDGLTLQSIWR